MTPFVYEAQPTCVVFGLSSFARLGDEVRSLGRRAIVLPHVVAYNRLGASVAASPSRVARAMGTDDAAGALYRLVQRIGAQTALKDLGMSEAGISRAVDLALENPYWNPQPITREGLTSLLSGAFWGRPPGRHDGGAAAPDL